MDTSLTDARKDEYAEFVASVVGDGVKPGQVRITAFMQGGAWSAVYASTPKTDDGVLFFETEHGQKKFKDVWGGWADHSDTPALVAWAKGLGAPEVLARCFAHTVTE